MKSRRSIVKSMDDLPDAILFEILCRFASYKIVSQCKCVSKRWCTLMSDPCFISRFICVQSEFHQQTQTTTLINYKGKEFLNRLPNPLEPFFEKLKIMYGLEKEPFVVATYNDLLLCGVGPYCERNYYICNPFTQQSIALPSPPRCDKDLRVFPEGFMCDLPYYKYTEDGHVQLNTEYRCRVVRLIRSRMETSPRKYKVQIFSCETGEWNESIVSGSDFLTLDHIQESYLRCYKGMLYWIGFNGCLLGLDPFMINNTTRDQEHYNCRIIKFPHGLLNTKQLHVCGWGLKVVTKYMATGKRFSVLEFRDEELYGDLKYDLLEHYTRRCYTTPGSKCRIATCIALDPNDEDILYLNIHQKPVMFNLGTESWLEIADKSTSYDLDGCTLPVVVPWWPTPVPRLPQHARPPMKRRSCIKRSYALRSSCKANGGSCVCTNMTTS